MPTDAELQAIEHRRQQQARERVHAERELLKRGDQAAALNLRRNWVPVTAPADELAVKDWQS